MMEPTIKIDNFSFFNADNMSIMAQYPDKYFDLAIVDPPYGINWTKTIDYTEKQKVTQKKGGYKIHSVKEWDKLPPETEYFNELFRVSKNQIVWGGNYFTDKLPISRCWIIWHKKDDSFTAINSEMAWTSFDSKVKIISRYTGLDKGFMNKDGGGIHPTEKPTFLYDSVLKEYAKPNMKILDTHLGSGSIALAIDKANKLDNMNLEFVGIELDKEYFDKSIERFKINHSQQTIF